MTESGTPDLKGQICWFEIPVTDVARASAFYTSVLEWDCSTESNPGLVSGVKALHRVSRGRLQGHFLVVSDASAVATTHDPSRLDKGGPVATFMVDSIDESAGKITAAGGKMHVPKTAIGGGMGYFARFVDSEGNLLGIWSSN